MADTYCTSAQVGFFDRGRGDRGRGERGRQLDVLVLNAYCSTAQVCVCGGGVPGGMGGGEGGTSGETKGQVDGRHVLHFCPGGGF